MFSVTSNVLIVDDMLTMRKLVTKALKELGFTNISEASDGVKGWEVISAGDKKIDLVISDWNMPNCSGLDLLKRVRADSRFAKTPFVLLTAESDKAQVIEAIKAGVDGYIVKPFTSIQLSDKLNEVYKKKFAA